MEVKSLFCFFLVVLFILNIAFASAEITGKPIDTHSTVIVGSITVLADTFNGSTNNFSAMLTGELASLSNLTLERTSYGKAAWQETVDLFNVANASDVVDFDSYFNISSNNISINNAMLPDLNKNTRLSLYGLSFINPGIKQNGVVCASGCTKVSYGGGTLIFDVTNFSSYYSAYELCGNGVCDSDETSTNCLVDCPITVTPPGGGGAPSGGGAVTPPSAPAGIYDFYLDKYLMEIEMNKGTYFQKKIVITNNGTRPLSITTDVAGLKNFISPQESDFTLEVGESKELNFDVYVSDKSNPDIYVGKIYLISENVNKSVDVVLSVLGQPSLLDVQTTVLHKFISPGSYVPASLKIINLGQNKNIEVQVDYYILDFYNNKYDAKRDSIQVGYSSNKTLILKTPSNLRVGNYLFYTKVSYESTTISSYDTFVIEKVSYLAWGIVLLIIITLVAIIIAILWGERRIKKKQGDIDKNKNKEENY
jgi:hypothetical protein